MRVRPFERREYAACLAEMRLFTSNRSGRTEDEIWLVEHEPVFTLGLASKPEHLLAVGDIPCIATERGGQVTFHGPGQVVAYLLLDLRRAGLMVRDLVCRMEASVIDTLAGYGVMGSRVPGAPGVYVQTSPKADLFRQTGLSGHSHAFLPKIASLGIKVSRGCTYHGLAFNVDMDLEPFTRINPCGYPGQVVTDLRKVLILNESKSSLNEKTFYVSSCLHPANGQLTGQRFLPNPDAFVYEVANRLGETLKRQLTGIQ